MMADEKLYLKELGEKLNQSIARIKKFTTVESNVDLIKELGNIVNIEKKIRQRCGIGARFKVISTQLQGILKKFTERVQRMQSAMQKTEKTVDVLTEDEMLVYVHLFNAQGATLKNWQNLLLPRALVDHSVNRPIYAKQKDIEQALRSKPNKEQHSYLVIKIKKADVLQNKDLRDAQGFSLLRVKHGALETDNIKEFVHNDQKYKVSPQGKLSKKED
jgi:hypothetical protein